MSLFTFHIHLESPPELTEELHQIGLYLRRIEGKTIKIMATEEETLAKLEEANTITNEIAADLQSLLDTIANTPQVPESVKTAIAAHIESLKAVAAVV